MNELIKEPYIHIGPRSKAITQWHRPPFQTAKCSKTGTQNVRERRFKQLAALHKREKQEKEKSLIS